MGRFEVEAAIVAGSADDHLIRIFNVLNFADPFDHGSSRLFTDRMCRVVVVDNRENAVSHVIGPAVCDVADSGFKIFSH